MSEYNQKEMNAGSPGENSGGEYGSGSLNRESARNYTQPPYGNPYHGSPYGGSPYGGTPYNRAPAEPSKKQRRGLSKGGLIALCLVVSFVAGMAGSLVSGLILPGSGGAGNGTSVVYQTGNAGVVDAEDTGSLVGNVTAAVQDTVVSITTESLSTNSFMPQYVETGAGSGVIYTSDGYIVTCNHVVEGADNIIVTLMNGDQYTATLVGADPSTDLAVIKIDASGLKSAVVGSSDGLKVGETAIAIGNPLGTLGFSVSSGIISALEREVTVEGQTMTLLQTDAAVNPGNSGGGLFDSDGNLIGIVNAKSSGDSIEGIGFAIPISAAVPVIQSLMENGFVAGRPALGVTVVNVQDAATASQFGVSRYGVYIYTVNEGSGAEKAGLEPGDFIVSVNGTAIETSSDLTNLLAELTVGDSVEMQIIREGKILEITVELTDSQNYNNG